MLKLGEILVSRGLISRDQLAAGLFAQRQFGGRLGTTLIDLGYMTDDALAVCLSQQLGIPYARPQALAAIPREVIARVPRKLAERLRAVPIRFENGALHVGMADPQDFERLDELAFALTCQVRPNVVTEVTLNYALERYYGIQREIRLVDPSAGIREMTPSLPAPAPLALFDYPSAPEVGVLEELAEVRAREDVVRSVFRYFSELFDEVLILTVGDEKPLLVAAGNYARNRSLPQPIPTPVAESGFLRGVLSKSQALHQPVITDPELKRMCAAAGCPVTNVSFIPIFDGNRPTLMVLAQGRDERDLMKTFAGIKTFVAKAAHALRIVALRHEIRAA